MFAAMNGERERSVQPNIFTPRQTEVISAYAHGLSGEQVLESLHLGGEALDKHRGGVSERLINYYAKRGVEYSQGRGFMIRAIILSVGNGWINCDDLLAKPCERLDPEEVRLIACRWNEVPRGG